jgi:molybdopterin biosynthesis enzyme
VEGLGSSIAGIVYVADDSAAVIDGFRSLDRAGARLILTAGARSMDPSDACFVALAELGGVVIRRGVPAHPGSMLWLGRLGRTPIIGLPTCGAYSKATAADLLLPRLLAGEPPSRATIARLGHGGILTRAMRFRFPAYARELEAPDG